MSTYIVKSLEQAKLLTDPFKAKLLERFAGNPVTTKQVADLMGEKAPRLYRHVDALFEAGLLELVQEKPKRGTVERYFRTVASRFEVDPHLFSSSPEQNNESVDMMRSLFRETEADLLHLLEQPEESFTESAPQPLLIRVALSGNKREIGRLRDKLEEWLKECDELAEKGERQDDDVAYAGLLTFYPVPKAQKDNDHENQN
jgi:DNA-binding transcriptional ArsR family regulator